jgi:hypothetical protein
VSDQVLLARGPARFLVSLAREIARFDRSRWLKLVVLLGMAMWADPRPYSLAQGPSDSGVADGGATEARQTVLGPGLYVFQTRTRDASCGDSEPDGYVLSFFAAIHGIPHSTKMTMELVNTPHFREWTLQVVNNQTIIAKSRIGTAADGPESNFEVKIVGDRFKGTGYRSYNGAVGGKKQRCRVNYDALLRRLDG